MDKEKMIEEIKEVIENVKQNLEWISVKERLPDTNCDVLVVKKNNKVFFMSYHAPFDSGKRIFQWWGFGGWLDQNNQITHWMPIPNPPNNLENESI